MAKEPRVSKDLQTEFSRVGTSSIPGNLEATHGNVEILRDAKFGDGQADLVVVENLVPGGKVEIRNYVPLEQVKVLNFANGDECKCGPEEIGKTLDKRAVEGFIDVVDSAAVFTEIHFSRQANTSVQDYLDSMSAYLRPCACAP